MGVRSIGKFLKSHITPLQWVSNDKTISSHISNRLGAQVGRTLAARAAWHARPEEPATEDIAQLVQSLDVLGFARIDSFVEESEFKKLCENVQRLRSDENATSKLHNHVGVKVRHYNPALDIDPYDLEKVFHDERVMSIFSHAERASLAESDVECLVEEVWRDNDEVDKESVFHSDIYFNTFKAWLYLDDVKEDGGPLQVVPGSHHITASRMKRIYRESVGENRGSRRISESEMLEAEAAPASMTVPKNTLIVANVHAYHKRGSLVLDRRRHALLWTLRRNPFFPKWMDRMNHA